jgi:hypothetical protein
MNFVAQLTYLCYTCNPKILPSPRNYSDLETNGILLHFGLPSSICVQSTRQIYLPVLAILLGEIDMNHSEAVTLQIYKTAETGLALSLRS